MQITWYSQPVFMNLMKSPLDTCPSTTLKYTITPAHSAMPVMIIES